MSEREEGDDLVSEFMTDTQRGAFFDYPDPVPGRCRAAVVRKVAYRAGTFSASQCERGPAQGGCYCSLHRAKLARLAAKKHPPDEARP